MIVTLPCVVDDGTVPPAGTLPAVPKARRIEVPRGDHLVLKLELVRRSGAPFDLTGSSVVFSIGRALFDQNPLLTRAVVITNPPSAGKAEVLLDWADTINLVEQRTYTYDVQLTDAAARRWQVVPLSELHILPIIGQPD